MKKWKTLSRQLIEENRFASFKVDEFETAEGNKGSYYYHLNNNAACAFAQLSEDQFVMLREYRYLLDQISLSHVQARVEIGEDAIDAAHREVIEEVGYKAGEMISLGWMASAPAISKEVFSVFLARDLSLEEKNNDEFEDTEVVIMSRAQIDEAVVSGEIWDSNVIATWQKVKMFLDSES